MPGSPSSYFIKPEYTARKSTHNDNFWTSGNRALLSYYAGLPAYKKCKQIILQNNLKSVIDIGCGTADKLMKTIYPVCSNILGIDTAEAVKICKAKYTNANFMPCDIESSKMMKKEWGQYDLIICRDVIEHLLDPNKLLDFIKKVSNTNSIIALFTPERDILRGKECTTSSKPEHVREWNLSEFASFLKYHNFKVLEHKVINNFSLSIRPTILKQYIYLRRRYGTTIFCQMAIIQKNKNIYS